MGFKPASKTIFQQTSGTMGVFCLLSLFFVGSYLYVDYHRYCSSYKITQQTIFFMREAQKIFEDGFSAEMALGILSDTWSAASEKQQAEWKKRGATFRPSSVQNSSKKTQTPDAASQQS